MRRRWLLCLALVSFACHEHSLPTDPGEPVSGLVVVTGRVLDFSSAAPRSGATVLIGSVTRITDATGTYTAELSSGDYPVTVDAEPVGFIRPRLGTYQADFLVNGGSCRTRYGRIYDVATAIPVAGATVSLGATAVTGPDGSYRLDLGCDGNGGSGTTFMTVSHPGYQSSSTALRYEHLAPPFRLDVALKR